MNAPYDPITPNPAASFVSPRALARGLRLGRFEIIDVLADTGLGIEYLAVDRARDGEFVLKEYLPQRLARRDGTLMQPQTAADVDALERGRQAFVEEARALAHVEHPALLRVVEVIEANATAYQVLPHLGGTPLLQVRQEMPGPPDEHALRALLDGLLGALQTLHRHELLHGAVSPNRILLLSDDRPLLLGPEVAREEVASDLVESLMAAVEPSFDAPEQRDATPTQALGPWTDLYGLAETIRFCISGELPPPASAWPGDGRIETTAQMVQRLFGAPATAHYSARLLSTLDAALDLDPAARPQSVEEFREALGATYIAARTDPVLTTPVAAPPQPVHARGRVEPAFMSGSASKPPKMPPVRTAAAAPEISAVPFSPPPPAPAPAAAAPPRPDPPRAVFNPPRTRQRAWWALAGLTLVLSAGLYAYWRASQPLPLPLPSEATSAGAPTPPAAAAPEPAPAAAPVAAPTVDPAPAPASAAAAASASAAPQQPAPVTEPEPPAAAAPTPPPAPVVEAEPAPAAPAARPEPRAAAPRPKAAVPAPPPAAASPRDACAGRTQFSLYRCMQAQCEQRAWAKHPQCERLRSTDSVD